MARRASALAILLTVSLCAYLPTSSASGSSPHLGLREDLLTSSPSSDDFPYLTESSIATLWVDRANDWRGVMHAVTDLQNDTRALDEKSRIIPKHHASQIGRPPKNAPHVVIIGTVGKSALIEGLTSASPDAARVAAELKGKWESFAIFVLQNPLAGVEKALVIMGSDKRGTIYGIYELSEQLGVSPWYWWADVPIRVRSAAHVDASTTFLSGEPHVKYRGIFLNDETPALESWAYLKFGGFNVPFYINVYELLLRLRGNFLWPAMWPGHTFSGGDPANPLVADEYGIIISTSHHEPMMRHHQDWDDTRKNYGNSLWSFVQNLDGVLKFWREGIQTYDGYEVVTTVGMRGDGDLGLAELTPEIIMELIDKQRELITEVRDVPAESVPQAWALYKETQDFFTEGEVDVPDDVMLLWCEDNFGNVRRLGVRGQNLTARAGGMGIYYHFEYVGVPRVYPWMNTNQLPKVAEQMAIVDEWGVDTLWLVNVGDLKPIEVPMEYWLRSAWEPERWLLNRDEGIRDFSLAWAVREFGEDNAEEAVELYRLHTKYMGFRKPELLDPEVFTPLAYSEAFRVLDMWTELDERVDKFFDRFEEGHRDHVYELLVHPIKALTAVHKLYIYAKLSHVYAAQKRVSANDAAEACRHWFQVDADLTTFWNEEFAEGKWKHLQDTVHIGILGEGYPFPPHNTIPMLAKYAPGDDEPPAVGMAIEGFEESLFGGERVKMPSLYSQGGPSVRYIDMFRSGGGDSQSAPFTYRFYATSAFVEIHPEVDTVANGDVRVEISVPNWVALPANEVTEVELRVILTGATIETVYVELDLFNGDHFSCDDNKLLQVNPDGPDGTYAPVNPDGPDGTEAPDPDALPFVDLEGYIAIEAKGAHRVIDTPDIKWEYFEDLGRGPGSYILSTSKFPPQSSSSPIADRPSLEFDVLVGAFSRVDVTLVVMPTLSFVDGDPQRVAAGFDDFAPLVQPFTINAAENSVPWLDSASDNIRRVTFTLPLTGTGFHTLKIWAVDAGLVLQRVEIDLGGLRPSYLGPPESSRSDRLPPTKPQAKALDTAARIYAAVDAVDFDLLGSDFAPRRLSSPPHITYNSADPDMSVAHQPTSVAAYTVNFPCAGTYRLFVNLHVGPSGKHDDSFFVAKTFGKSDASQIEWRTIDDLYSAGETQSDAVLGAGSRGSVGYNVWKWIDVSALTGGLTFDVAEPGATVWAIGGRDSGLSFTRFVFVMDSEDPLSVRSLSALAPLPTVDELASPALRVLVADAAYTGRDLVPTGDREGIQFVPFEDVTTYADGFPGHIDHTATYYLPLPATADTYKLYARVRNRSTPTSKGDASIYVGNGVGHKRLTVSADWIVVSDIPNVGQAEDPAVVTDNSAAAQVVDVNVWKWVDMGVTYSLPSRDEVATEVFVIGGRGTLLDVNQFVFMPASRTVTVADLQ